MHKFSKPELLAPAGNWASLTAAVKSGADAVYFGIDKLNMRAKANNFKLNELSEIVSFCKKNNVDTHLTLNTIVYENEIDDVRIIVEAAKNTGVTLIICWDMSVVNICREYKMPFCISTQASISNSEAAKYYFNLGAARIVLARECNFEQIKEIKNKTGKEIETFIHGAMCVAISGRCFMSHYAFNKSANRGECVQPCRREYEIYDTDGQSSFKIGSGHVMSPKDLCSIEFIDKLIEAGIDSFKIEGRKRSPEYISTVVSTYRQAIDLYFEGKLTIEKKAEFLKNLKTVYNRGFSTGFYFGMPSGGEFTEIYGSLATTKKIFVGKVINYFKKSGIVHVLIQNDNIKINDRVLIIGNRTGVLDLTINHIVKDGNEIIAGNKGDDVTFKCPETAKVNDLVYKIIDVFGEVYNGDISKKLIE